MMRHAASAHAALCRLLARGPRGLVLSVHRRTVNLRLGAHVVVIGAAGGGNGPMTALLADALLPGDLGWSPGDPVAVVGPLLAAPRGGAVRWDEAAPWEPPPPPEARAPLRPARDWLAAALERCAARKREAVAAPAVLRLLGVAGGEAGAPARGFVRAAAAALESGAALLLDALRRAEEGGAEGGDGARRAALPQGLVEAVRSLVGVGSGLTPAGDDLLAGTLLTLRRAGHPLAPALAGALRPALAAGRTGWLSAHFLRWAAAGVGNERALALVDALLGGSWPASGPPALEDLLAWGASSGSDFAAGVLLALDVLAGSREAAATAGYHPAP